MSEESERADERVAAGAAAYRQVMGVEPPERQTVLSQVGTHQFVFGELWNREGLSRRHRRMVTLACLAIGGNPEAMDRHLYGALRGGELSIEELQEVVLHVAVYSGWPMAERLDDAMVRQWQRLQSEEGDRASELPPPWRPEEPFSEQNRDARGEVVFNEVMTFAPPPAFNPYTAVGVRGFVFGEMWDRPGLSRKDRRFITLACVCAADAVVPVESHVYAALNSGDVTLEEVAEVSLQCAVYSGWPKASFFESVIRQQWTKITDAGGPLTAR